MAPHTAAPFHLLAKPAGSTCNLACEYCYFRAKAALYACSEQRMPDEVLDAYLRQLFAAQPSGEVSVAWQGGEPTLMGIPFFERAVELAERCRRGDQRVEHTLQTNATLIDDEWAAFLAENRFLVGVSIDGPAEVHDAHRRDPLGRGTHEHVIAGIRCLEARGVQWNALVAVSAASEGRGADVYRFLKDGAGARFVQFIPVVERPTRKGVPFGGEATPRSITPEGYGSFMIDVFEEWVRRDVGRVFVQQFDDALAAHAGEPRMCLHSAACGRALALEFNGDVYSCDHFVQPDHLLGNVLETSLARLVESGRQAEFGRSKATALPLDCAACRARFACNGGCPKDRFVPDPSGGPDLNYLCAGYQAFFAHTEDAMQAMAALLRAGRAPAEIMLGADEAQDLSRAARAAGRNDPCPCGSGLKAKRCHGARR